MKSYDFEKIGLRRKYDASGKSPKDRPSLGAKVSARRTMRRVMETGRDGRAWLTWAAGPENRILGVYVGYRIKKSGFTQFIGYEEGPAFVQTGSVSVALIVTAENKNPVAVDWDGLE